MKNLSYEEALKELEKILEDLEVGDASLEESVDKFKEGLKLYNYCNDLISKAEGEVKILLESEKGKIEEIGFILEA